jgi:hypothetical protein
MVGFAPSINHYLSAQKIDWKRVVKHTALSEVC